MSIAVTVHSPSIPTSMLERRLDIRGGSSPGGSSGDEREMLLFPAGGGAGSGGLAAGSAGGISIGLGPAHNRSLSGGGVGGIGDAGSDEDLSPRTRARGNRGKSAVASWANPSSPDAAMRRDVVVAFAFLTLFSAVWFGGPLVLVYGVGSSDGHSGGAADDPWHLALVATAATATAPAATHAKALAAADDSSSGSNPNVGACLPYNPCRRGAQCVPLSVAEMLGAGAGARFRCLCPSGTTGPLCERLTSSPLAPPQCPNRRTGEAQLNPLFRHMFSDSTAERVWRDLIDQYVHVSETGTAPFAAPGAGATTASAATAAAAVAPVARKRRAPVAVEVGSSNGLPSVYAAERGFQVLLLEPGLTGYSLHADAAKRHGGDDDDDDDHERAAASVAASAGAGASGGAHRFASCVRAVAKYERHWVKRKHSHDGAGDHRDDDDDDDDDDDHDDDDDDDDREKKKRKHKKEKRSGSTGDSGSSSSARTPSPAAAAASAAPATSLGSGLAIGRGHIELLRAAPVDHTRAEQWVDARLQGVSSSAVAAVRVPGVTLDSLLSASDLPYVYALKLSGPLVDAPGTGGAASAIRAALDGLRSYLCHQRVLYVVIRGFWPAGMARLARTGSAAAAGVGAASARDDAARDVLETLWSSGYTVYDLSLQRSAARTADGGADGDALDAGRRRDARHSGHGHGHHSATDKLAARSASRAALRTANQRPMKADAYSAWFERFDRSATPAAAATSQQTGAIADAVWTDLLAVASVEDLTPFV